MTVPAEAHARLAAEHEALMQFLYLAPVGLVQTAADGEILMINPISAQLLMPLQRDGNLVNLFDALAGVAPDLRHLCATFGRPNGMVCDGMHIPLDGTGARAHERTPRRAPQVLSLSLLKLDGARLMAVLSDVTALAGPDDPAYCLVLRDVCETRRKSLFCDHLTGVANRRAFFEAAELELNRNRRARRPTALILVDADHFKRINDRHGHPGGDAVLRHLGRLLAATFRQVDVVARVGGEEFAVLLPSSSLDGAAAVAERLRQRVASAPVAFVGAPIGYTISAGVAVCDGEKLGLDALMKRAGQALYAAKAGGRNRVERWHPALDGRTPNHRNRATNP